MSTVRGSLPYPGLRPFREDEGHLFYGRRRHINDLLERLIRSQTVFVIGPSGCGKSSLVRPGLYDTLLAGNFPRSTRDWRFVYARPGNDPVQALGSGIGHAGAIQIDTGNFDLATLLYERNALAELLKECPLSPGQNLLFLIDQFEEIFSEENSGNRDELIRFVQIITDFARDTPERAFLVVTMRSDFIGDCTAFDGLAEVINDTHYLVPPLDDGELIEAITSPSEDLGAVFPDPLKQRLMDDAHIEKQANFERGYDILPLVQHTVQRAWIAACTAQGVDPRADYRNLTDAWVGLEITEQHYLEIGPLAQALGRHADELFEKLLPDTSEDRSTIEHVTEIMFKRLTRCTPAGKFVRSPTTRGDLLDLCADSGSEAATVDVSGLLEHTLEVFSDDTVCFIRTDGVGHDQRVDIGHESLIRQWEKLRCWARDEAHSGDFYKILIDNAKDWESPDDLLHGTRLQRAREWRDDPRYSPPWARRYGTAREFDAVVDFVESSKARQEELERAERSRERELKKEKAKKRQRRQLWIAVPTLILVVASISWAAYLTWQRDEERHTSIAEAAAALPASEALTKALLVRELKALEDPPSLAIQAAHDAAVQMLPAVRHDRAHSDSVWDVAFTPDGDYVVSAGNDGSVKICSADASVDCRELGNYDSSLYALAVSNDGRFVAVAGQSGAISLYDLQNPGPSSEIGFLQSSVWDLDFTPDDQWIVSGHDDGTIARWNRDGGDDAVVLGKSNKTILSLDVDSQGRWVASAGMGARIELWDLLGDGRISHKQTDGVVNGLTVNRSGTRIGFGTAQGDIGIWDIANDVITNVGGGQELVYRVDFAPDDDRRLVSTHKNGWRLWQAGGSASDQRWKASDRWRQTGKTVLSVKFDPSGVRLVTGYSSGAVSVWRLDRQTEPLTVDIGSATPGCGFVYRIKAGRWPDGRPIATYACLNGQVGRISLDGSVEPSQVAVVGRFTAADLNDSGNVIVTGTSSGEIIRWRLDQEDSGHRIGQHRCGGETDNVCSVKVRAVALAPDGSGAVSATQSGEIMWSSLRGGTPRLLGQHKPGPALMSVSPLAFDPSGRYVASGSDDGSIRIWPTDGTGDFRKVHDARGRNFAVVSLTFSPDGKYLASTHANGNVRVWPQFGGADAFLIGLQKDLVTSVGFSPDGRYFASTDSDGVARIWNLESQVEMFKMADPLRSQTTTGLNYLSSPDERDHRLVSFGRNVVQVWRPNWPALIEYLTEVSRACLSVEEREFYLRETQNEAASKSRSCTPSDSPD